MKKFLSLLLAALMLFALCAPAMAATPTTPTGSITVTLPNKPEQNYDDAVFTAYQALDISLGEGGTLVYKWSDWVTNPPIPQNEIADKEKIEEKDLNMASLEAQLKNGNVTADATASIEGNVATFDNLKPGIYLIQGSNAIYIFKTILGSIQIKGGGTESSNVADTTSKYDKPDLDKKINGKDDYDTVGVGDTVTFDLYVPNIPDYPDTFGQAGKPAPTFTLTDTMSAGLTYAETKFVEVVERIDGNRVAEITGYGNTGKAGTQEFVYTFTDIYQNQLKAHAGKILHVQYTATINEKAILASDTHKNEVRLDYNNGFKTDSVQYYTYGIEFEKVDGKNAETKLPGVKFSLSTKDAAETATALKFSKDESGAYYPDATNGSTVIVTGEGGKVVIKGLDEGTYYLKETETLADAGYVLLSDEQKITLTANEDDPTKLAGGNAVVTLDPIKNYKGFSLPSTGGMGTTVFMVVGIALMAGVVVIMMVSNRKKAKKAE